jgi:hypothetical protein
VGSNPKSLSKNLTFGGVENSTHPRPLCGLEELSTFRSSNLFPNKSKVPKLQESQWPKDDRTSSLLSSIPKVSRSEDRNSVKISAINISERKPSFHSKLEDYFPKSKPEFYNNGPRATQDSLQSSDSNLTDFVKPMTFGITHAPSANVSIAQKLRSADFNCFKKIQMKKDFKELGLEYGSGNKNTRSTGSFLTDTDLKNLSPSARKAPANIAKDTPPSLSNPLLPFNIPNFMNNFNRNAKNAGERIHSNLDLNITSSKKRRLIYSSDQPLAPYSPIPYDPGSIVPQKSAGLSPRKTSITQQAFTSHEGDFLKSYYSKINMMKDYSTNRGKSASLVKKSLDVLTENGLDTRRRGQVVLGSSGHGG